MFCVLQLKVVEKSGLNRDGTFLPPAIHPSFAKEPKYDMKTAMVEAEMVMGGVVADVLEKTGVQEAVVSRVCQLLCWGHVSSSSAGQQAPAVTHGSAACNAQPANPEFRLLELNTAWCVFCCRHQA